jgi:HAD superfamily hydrolase (TIGR01509 family)
MQLRGMIFDVDGTLVDSNDAHASAWVDAFRDAGIAMPFGAVRRLIGMGGDKLLARLVGIDAGSARGKKLVEASGRIFKTHYLDTVKPFAGVRTLFEKLAADGVRRGIASSAKLEELHALLDVAGIADLVDAAVSSDDADHSKPDADTMQAALDRLKLAPGDAIAVGDTPYDVKAARRAHIDVIALRCGGWGDGDLAGARQILDSPEDLLAYYSRTLRAAA